MITEKQIMIDKFFQMIRKLNLNRTAHDFLEVQKFFAFVSETKLFTPPTVEFMTILKNYRPQLFYEFKASLFPDSRHSMASINFDLGQAIINLGITDIEQLRAAVKGI